MNPHTLKRLVPALGIVSLLGLTACNPAERLMENAIENETDGEVNVDLSEGGLNIETEEGTFRTGNELPEGWPEDAPLYENATIQYSASANEAPGNQGAMVVLMTEDDAATVVEAYKTMLATNGWTVAGNMQGGANTFMSATKGELVLSLAIASNGEQTSITMGVGNK